MPITKARKGIGLHDVVVVGLEVVVADKVVDVGWVGDDLILVLEAVAVVRGELGVLGAALGLWGVAEMIGPGVNVRIVRSDGSSCLRSHQSSA